MIVPPALLQLPSAQLPASAVVVYVALLTHLDTAEYRPVNHAALTTATGYADSALYASLAALAQHGFLDVRGLTARKYRLLLSQRVGVSHAAA